MFDTMQVGRRIRQARIEKNMTQMALAPFLDEGYLDELAQELAVSDMKQVVALAPFLHERTVIALAHKAAAEDMNVLFALAPFVDERTLDELALSLKDKGPVDRSVLAGLAPFLSQKTLLALLQP